MGSLAAAEPTGSTPAWHDPATHVDHEAVLTDAFEAHHAMLRRRLLVRMRDEAAADDLAQDAFARLLREVCAGRQPDNVAGWLHRTAMNLATSRARHVDVERRHAPGLGRDDVIESPERAAEGAEAVRLLHTAVAQLPEADRALILLAANGATGAQLAVQLGRSETAARTALCRARERLRLFLACA